MYEYLVLFDHEPIGQVHLPPGGLSVGALLAFAAYERMVQPALQAACQAIVARGFGPVPRAEQGLAALYARLALTGLRGGRLFARRLELWDAGPGAARQPEFPFVLADFGPDNDGGPPDAGSGTPARG